MCVTKLDMDICDITPFGWKSRSSDCSLDCSVESMESTLERETWNFFFLSRDRWVKAGESDGS